jgi:drug/metabolite transporter (DMT)-like permease
MTTSRASIATSVASPGGSSETPRPALTPDVVAALALVYLIWSSTYLAIRVMVRELPPFGSGGVRFLLAGAILLAVQRIRGHALPSAKNWLAALPIGVLLFAVGNGLVASAERSVGSGVVAVVCGTMPLWAAVMGPLVGERASWREWAGMFLGLAGVIVLVAGGELRADPAGVLLPLLASIGWAAGSLLARRLPIAHGPTGAATQMIAGGAFMVAISALSGEARPASISFGTMMAFVYLVIFGSMVAFSAYNHLLARARPAVAMSYAYVNPVLAVLLGATLGAERIGPEVVLATVLIAGAVFLLIRGRSRATAVRSIR